MLKFFSQENAHGFHKVVLEEAPEGTYVLVYETARSSFPEKDYLQDDLESAREMCREDFGIPVSSWVAQSE